jgi:hypothetical protein
MSYAIRNQVTGGVLSWDHFTIAIADYQKENAAQFVCLCSFGTYIPLSMLMNSMQWTLKNQEDGGTAIESQDYWVAPGLKSSTIEHSYRFIRAEARVGRTFY